MSIKKLFFFTLLVLFFLSACKEEDPISPISLEANEEELFKRDQSKSNVKVLSRNIYVGADVDKIMQTSNPEEIPLVVAEVFQQLFETNFPERAQALAQEIFHSQPHLIGLQEVSLIRMQSPGDFLSGGSVLAEDVVMDYLEILLTTMRGMGLDYEVAAKIQNADVEMPMIVSFEEPYDFDDVRLTDYDVILVKKGIQISDVEERNFRAKVSIPEMGLELPRGYTAVTAEINGNSFRFVNTHLEDADQGGDLLKIQLAQVAELLLRLARVKTPVILVGDFNSAAPNEATYRAITFTKRFQDTWLMNSNVENMEGYTYGHDLDLRNETQNFWKRIDYVFVRNGWGPHNKLKLAHVSAEVLGDEVSDRTTNNLWPSDHGGVLAGLKFEACKKNKKKRFE